MSEPYEEEMLQRARWLCENRGEEEICLDKAHEVKFRSFRFGRLSASIDERTDQVRVALKFEGIDGSWLIYYESIDGGPIFRTEAYKEAVEIMRPLMLLDDLADV